MKLDTTRGEKDAVARAKQHKVKLDTRFGVKTEPSTSKKKKKDEAKA